MNLHRMAFGRLTVDDERDVRYSDKVRCLCSCGAVVHKEAGNLRGGRISSCGCLRNSWQKHTTAYSGAFKHPLYPLWRGMHSRCYGATDISYRYYGGKGIRVSEEWWDFSAFVRDVGQRPEGTTLDRLDPTKDYSESNCRWASAEQQGANKSSAFVVMYRGVAMSMAELSAAVGVPSRSLLKRMHRLLGGAKPSRRTSADTELNMSLMQAKKLADCGCSK